MPSQSRSRREFLKSSALLSGASLVASSLPRFARAAERRKPDLPSLRDKIDHIVVIYQENRSFDHYFGTYRHPKGVKVENLLDAEGGIDRRFFGLQRNPAGISYRYLPLPGDIAAFDNALLENKPFHLAPYMPAASNVPFEPTLHFFRMFAQIDKGVMDHFVALALEKHHAPFGRAAALVDPLQMMFAESTPCGAVLGHYRRADLPDYHHIADEYVLFDHFFQAMAGGSTGNALHLVSARPAVWREAPESKRGSLNPPVFDLPYDHTGTMINDLPPLNGPTETKLAALKIAPPPAEQTYPNIGERLAAASLSWAWYNENWNLVKPWALKTAFGPDSGSAVLDSPDIYVPHHNPFQYYPSWFSNVRAGCMRDASDFFEDLRSGRLPHVSFIKASGAHDEHPKHSAPRWGEQWVMDILKAVGQSRLWSRTAIIITYDEGGGFWDHVAPPRADAYGRGTRLPALMVSPWAKPGYVDHEVSDTASILALIETRFGLKPLLKRDAEAYNMLGAFDFEQRPRAARFA